MTRFLAQAFVGAWLIASQPLVAQSLNDLKGVWQQTFDALSRGDQNKADSLFDEFNRQLRVYATANNLTWEAQYLAGTLDCRFPDSRTIGARFLSELRQNARSLSDSGQAAVKQELEACTASTSAAAPSPSLVAAAPVAHFQNPGVHGDMKGGARFTTKSESSLTVSPKSAEELQARRLPLAQSAQALQDALGRLPSGADGAVFDHFVVAAMTGGQSQAMAIGQCLAAYLPPLASEFDIEGPHDIITVYAADTAEQVYELAKTIHGLSLPSGVLAYSVGEDMSLAGRPERPFGCGSMAHEIVHLLIKQKFPLSPAWLEEGLASAVAVASPSATGFTFNRSWRDDTLKDTIDVRPRVAELLNMAWAEFNGRQSVFKQETAIAAQAMAAVFIRYLDARGKLRDVYFAVRDRRPGADPSSYPSYSEILEKSLGRGVADVDRDFSTWFADSMGR